jgi:hypothetical protein
VVDILPTENVVFSVSDTVPCTPPESPRTYQLAALSYRQRVAMLRDLRREGGIPPNRATLLAGLREALRQVAPDNLGECLATIDEAEGAPDDPAAQARLRLVELAAVDVPAYAALLDAQARWSESLPMVAARHALRGWSGPRLPPFAAEAGLVPPELLDLVPSNELEHIGNRAYLLAVLGRGAEGNSARVSPSSEIPALSTEG